MHRRLVIVLMIPLILLLWTCEKNPARIELERMDVKYSKKEFLRRVEQSDRDVVELFLSAGMSPNARDKDGTALMSAANEGNTDIVRLLVQHGADVNATQGDGDTALMYAAYRGHFDTVQFLGEHGADVNAKTKKGSTALNFATAGLRIEEKGDQAEVIRFLVKHGVDVNAQPKYSRGHMGETALIDAAWAGNLDVVRFLVEHGADVNAKSYQNRTALTWAVQDAPPEVVQYLLEHGADPNARIVMGGKDAGTALAVAENVNRPEVVKLLKEAGAKK